MVRRSGHFFGCTRQRDQQCLHAREVEGKFLRTRPQKITQNSRIPPPCIVADCSNITKDGFNLHCFPSDPKFRRIWTTKVKLTRAEWSGPTKHSVICSAHFEPSCFERNPNEKYLQFGIRFQAMLRPDAVPIIFSTSNNSRRVGEKRRQAFAKRERRRVRKFLVLHVMSHQQCAYGCLSACVHVLYMHMYQTILTS